ncbi:unnamed protein product [Paramecium pentaurelia]|uniref:Uncharacterized protein n=1 Tax=Paramecium pentaurelia TaxID=43138 RepID=A0A8S1U1L8_9CILI|nr:unnamed protein product [Paramecium pentaurelia]CAD8157517.1 unnamed protein product [Paramecium pentaurelia]
MKIAIEKQNRNFNTNVIVPYQILYYVQLMNVFTIMNDIQIKQEENEEKEKIIEQEETQKINQNNLKNQVTQCSNSYYLYPGQSKNYYKNMGQKIANFILQEFSEDNEIIQEPYIKKFLKMDGQKFNRNSIQQLIKSKKGRRICRLFFAQFKWVKPFVAQHKTDLDLNFRLNRQFYQNRKNVSQSTKVEDFQIKEEN